MNYIFRCHKDGENKREKGENERLKYKVEFKKREKKREKKRKMKINKDGAHVPRKSLKIQYKKKKKQ